jgi:hypothetical protein
MMRPAFTSTKQAAAFALLLLVVLLLPVLVGKNLLPTREQLYASQGWTSGPYPWIYNQIFEETNAIDVLFIGSSKLYYDIDTPHVQKELSRKLGRPAVVRSICWGGPGYDALNFITQDLLEHRKVRMLVFDEEHSKNDNIQLQAACWFRFADNYQSLQNLPIPRQCAYYLASIVGLPKNIMGLVRSNIPADLSSAPPHYLDAPNPATRLGSVATRLGFSPSLVFYDHSPFVVYDPQTNAQPADVCVFSQQTKENFVFKGPPVPNWQRCFGQKFAALVEAHGTKLVFLHMPVLEEVDSPVIQEREFWPATLHAGVVMMGIPPNKLFAGMTAEQVLYLFVDPLHLNQNGQNYFTWLITPSLLDIFDGVEGKP